MPAGDSVARSGSKSQMEVERLKAAKSSGQRRRRDIFVVEGRPSDQAPYGATYWLSAKPGLCRTYGALLPKPPRTTDMPRLRRSGIEPKYKLPHPRYSRNRQTLGVLQQSRRVSCSAKTVATKMCKRLNRKLFLALFVPDTAATEMVKSPYGQSARILSACTTCSGEPVKLNLNFPHWRVT